MNFLNSQKQYKHSLFLTYPSYFSNLYSYTERFYFTPTFIKKIFWQGRNGYILSCSEYANLFDTKKIRNLCWEIWPTCRIRLIQGKKEVGYSFTGEWMG